MNARSNNKRIGIEFERTFCKYLASKGYWVHFIVPDARGAQPFDVIAVKNGEAYAYDCKTSVKQIFPLSRLEDNQIYAFEKWLACGNTVPRIAVLFEGAIYIVNYMLLKEDGKVDLKRRAVCVAENVSE